MPHVNFAVIEGTLTSEVEFRKTPKGTSIAIFKIISYGGYIDREGNFVDRIPDRVEVTVFGPKAIWASRHLGHGDDVIVYGHVSGNEYQEKVYNKVICENLMLKDPIQREVVKPKQKVDTPNPDAPSEKTGEYSSKEETDDNDMPF